MARPLRLDFPGAVYYVTSRGNARQAIFPDKDDRESFLGDYHQWWRDSTGHAMLTALWKTNDLLAETREGNLSWDMRQLNGVYTQVFNRRHTRLGRHQPGYPTS